MSRGRSPYIRGMGCDGWLHCGNCGGVCSQDEAGDERPWKSTAHIFPQRPYRDAWQLNNPEWLAKYRSYREREDKERRR